MIASLLFSFICTYCALCHSGYHIAVVVVVVSIFAFRLQRKITSEFHRFHIVFYIFCAILLTSFGCSHSTVFHILFQGIRSLFLFVHHHLPDFFSSFYLIFFLYFLNYLHWCFSLRLNLNHIIIVFGLCCASLMSTCSNFVYWPNEMLHQFRAHKLTYKCIKTSVVTAIA